MDSQDAAPEPVSPFAYKILPFIATTEGKTVTKTFTLENGLVFLYNDNSAIVIATKSRGTWEDETPDSATIPEEEILDYFKFESLAKAGLLTQLYIIQEIGKKAGLNIVPAAEGGNTFRIDLTV